MTANTNRKSTAERTIEVLTWASVVTWLGFVLMAGSAFYMEYQWLVVMVLGVILISSAIYQRSRNWDTSFAIWIFGIWMAVFSVLEIVAMMVEAVTGNAIRIGLEVYLGVALISMGAASVFRIIQGPKVGPDLPAEYTGDYDRRDYTSRARAQSDRSWGSTGSTSALANDSRASGGGVYRPPTYGTSRSSSRAQYDQYDRDQYNRAPEYDERRGEYGEYYDDRTQSPADPYLEDDSAYRTRDDRRRARRLDDPAAQSWDRPTYDRPTQERQADYGAQRLSRQRARGRSQPQRTSRRATPLPDQTPLPGRASQPANNLESRVEDIINRSRSRRAQPDAFDDLDY